MIRGPAAGNVTTFSVADIQANPAIGPRIPDATLAAKQWAVATIVVSRDSLLTPEAMSFYDLFARRMELEVQTPIHQGLVKAIGKPLPSAHAVWAKLSEVSPDRVNQGRLSLQGELYR